MPVRKNNPDILKVAHESFGYESLRPGQGEAVRSILDGHDTIVIQPTGAGKSAIYQLAGLMIEGTTVVISPLIALQKDQVDSINSQNSAEAVVINSTQRVSETRETLAKIEGGGVEYIFLAPEQLRKEETMETLEASHVSLFVIDEAHCISEWGHDFRPDYLHISAAIERLGHPVVLATTATASPDVRAEIEQRLGMRNTQVFVHGFDRPNIHLRVDHYQTEQDKLQALVKRVSWAEKPGIVYVATRKNAESVMGAVSEEGITALFYHGGLKAKERHAIQQQFMSGNAEVIVATNAFGMGIDKADVRFVYHYDISDSIDSYYQEIGRSGRDGEKAEAVLFYRSENIGVQKFRTGQGALPAAEVQRVAEVLKEQGPLDASELAEHTGLSKRKLATVLHRLEDVGGVESLPHGQIQVNEEAEIAEAASEASIEQERHKESRRDRLRQMQEYAESSFCRRELLLRYFGDEFNGPCQNCDNCEGVKQAGHENPAAGTRREVA